MLVSVLMPVYNNIEFLKIAIDSVLSQTHTDIEFIIIDDCSTEPVWDFLHSYDDSRLVLMQNKENIGLIASLNLCLDISTGDYIARQDGDDISLSTRFEEELKLFNTGVHYISCWAESIDNQGYKRKCKPLDEIMKKPTPIAQQRTFDGLGSHIVGPAVMYSRNVFEKIGYYDEYLYFSEDTNFHIRALRYFNLGIVSKVLYQHRYNANSTRKIHPNRRKNTQGLSWRQFVKNRADKYPIINDKIIFKKD